VRCTFYSLYIGRIRAGNFASALVCGRVELLARFLDVFSFLVAGGCWYPHCLFHDLVFLAIRLFCLSFLVYPRSLALLHHAFLTS